MKKNIKRFLFIVLMVLFVNVSQVKAAGEVVAVDGASIRFKTDEVGQGLRFYAKLDETYKNNEHGFYLVFGEATVNKLEDAIVEAGSGPITLNGKEVFHVPVLGVNSNNEFSVVLLGIPEVGYFDELSAIPYVKVDGVLVFPSEHVKRSVAEVVLKMANAGEDLNLVEGVEQILETEKKKITVDSSCNIEISSGVYELNHLNLKDEFINDWNAKLLTSWTELDADTFYNSASLGLTDGQASNTDLSDSNLYKFFNDSFYEAKWGWLLDFLKEENHTIHTTRQIDAIKGDGTSTDGDGKLWHASHLIYSISNFFNGRNDSAGYDPINFVDVSKYLNVKDYNNKVYVSMEKYEFYNVGESYVLPAPKDIKEGYIFLNYKLGATTYNPGSSYVISDDFIIEAVYSVINYDVTFYDGEEELTSLNTTYNIESTKTLPTYEKDGLVFRGWYDNRDLDGLPITIIPKGSINDKTYYVKWSDTAIVKYHLGDYGYHTSENNKDDLFTEFVTDYKELFGRSATAENLKENFFNNSYIPEAYTFTDIFSYENSKYSWLKEHIIDLATKESHAALDNLNSGDQAAWRTQIEAFFMGSQFSNSLDFTMENNNHNFWKYTSYGIYEEDFVAGGPLFSEVLTDSLIYGLVGFKDKDGNVVTVLPEATTGLDLYAVWERSKFYVTFNINYSASSPEKQLVLKNSLASTPDINERAGYRFIGWYKDLNDEDAYDFTEPIVNDFILYAKWEETEAEEYNIIYNLDGGKIVYGTKDELINGFLDDFYNYLGLTTNINDFKHGVGNTTGYDGLWHQDHKIKIYAGLRPTAVNEEYFASSAAYMEKWLPFFDMIDAFVKEVNNTQFFWGAGTNTGLIRIRQYVTNIKPTVNVSNETMAMLPSVPVISVAITTFKVGMTLTLQTAYKENMTFKGWYLDALYSGEALTTLTQAIKEDVTLYAKFE